MHYRTLADIILDYKADYILPERLSASNWARFEAMSTAHWAADELYDYILKNGDPIDASSRFIAKMTEFMHQYPKTGARFLIAADVAGQIKDILICACVKGEKISYE